MTPAELLDRSIEDGRHLPPRLDPIRRLWTPISEDWGMKMTIRIVDYARSGVVVTFSDGSSTFFDSEFLYAHRHDKDNKTTPRGRPMVPLTESGSKAGERRDSPDRDTEC